MTLITVTGPADPDAVRLADAHNHLWIAPVAGAAQGSPVLTAGELIVRELRAFAAAAGGPCIQFDCQPGGFGRDARRLREFSETAGVLVACCTGFHLRRYAPSHWLWQADAARAAEHFIRELTDGVEEAPAAAPIRAGFIKIAFEQDSAETPGRLLEAVGAAVHATGCAVEVHTERGAAAERILPLLDAHNVPAGRVVLCHMDKRKDIGLHRDLIAAGALLEYDTFTRTAKYPDPYPFLTASLDAGLAHGIALATDLSTPEQWSAHGGRALAGVLANDALANAPTGGARHALLAGNIARRLSRAVQRID